MIKQNILSRPLTRRHSVWYTRPKDYAKIKNSMFLVVKYRLVALNLLILALLGLFCGPFLFFANQNEIFLYVYRCK